MSHRSRGCLRCRQRRVKCDETRPACQRCVTRNEICVGYRDDSDLMFQHQTEQVIRKNQCAPTYRPRIARRNSLGQLTPTSSSSQSPPTHLPWLSTSPGPHDDNAVEQQAVSDFIDKYVIYPCTESSSSGFLEHLPGLFKEVDVEGRYALRYAVQAASLADLSRSGTHDKAATKALEAYGRCLTALGKSLSGGKTPNDYDLMTVVMLDIFESLFLTDENFSMRNSHSQGMAHILRLRGHEQFHDPRGWGLFRLAYHRLQKEKLAKRLSPLPESQAWLDGLNSDLPFVQLEKSALKVSQVTEKARHMIQQITSGELPWEEVLPLVGEMYSIDLEALQWRQRPEWSFRTVSRDEITSDEDVASHLPETVEIHRDIWMAYEWNYHRTNRVILHQQLLDCLRHPSHPTQGLHSFSDEDISTWIEKSTSTIRTLVECILSSVPQSLGDIDCLGHYQRKQDGSAPRGQAIGSYLLLWPIKIIKSDSTEATKEQKQRAQAVFERIREHTGMKSHLGALSSI